MRRLLPVLVAASMLGAGAQAAPAAASPLWPRAGTVVAFRFGGHSIGRSYRPYGYRYGYGRRGHGFLHGLFVGWLLSHLFGTGGGIPLFPLVLLALAVWWWTRRRRRRARAWPGY